MTALLLAPLLAYAAPESQHAADSSEQLKAVDEQIRDVRSKLGTTRAERERLQAELSELDAEARRAALAERGASQRVADVGAELAALQSRERRLQTQLDAQRRQLAAHVRVLARVRNPNPLRFLLAGDDPAAGDRALHVFGYIARARQATLQAIDADARQIASVREQTAAAHEQLMEARARAAEQRERLASLIRQRKATAAQLDAAFESDQARLAALQQDRARLVELLEQLTREARSAPPSPLDSRRGQLPWPTRGQLAYAFGSAPDGSARGSGWFISAPEGQPVHPIHAGRVVYADWFRGLGLLVIVDHGEPYLSLYAHNQRVLVPVGSYVTPDTPIALVGASGTAGATGLYFELRVDGEPADPAAWLAGSP